MEIRHGNSIVLGGHCYILMLVEWYTRYVHTYGMHALFGADVIQDFQ